MTGLEKIINQIQEDARRDADAVIAQAKENADEILKSGCPETSGRNPEKI